MIIHHKITIVRINKPKEEDLNRELVWLADSLGITSARDKDRSCYRLFVELVKHPKRAMTSDELAYHLGLSRGTVIHHINRLIESGVVVPIDNKYILRVENLKSLVGEIEKEITKSFDEMKRIAEKIDKEIGL